MNRWIQVVALIFCVAGGPFAAAEPTTTTPADSNPAAAIPDILFIPTPSDVVDRMMELARVKKGDVVYDLGCGDGRILVAAAKKCGCRGVGFDIDPRRVEESEANVKKDGVENLVKIEKRDLFGVDLRPASVVVLYLSPKANALLLPQLEKLAPGSRIVSHQFDIREIKPDKVIEVNSKEDHHKHTLFLWKTPLKKRTLSDRRPP
jgi:precorrin-6B methylase 2